MGASNLQQGEEDSLYQSAMVAKALVVHKELILQRVKLKGEF